MSSNEKLELTILCNLIYNEEYIRKVLPFLKEDYFADFNERTIFLAVKDFVEKYNKPPTKESILIDLEKERSVDVIITRLRKKIEIDPKNPKFLQTIRGTGYVLWIE